MESYDYRNTEKRYDSKSKETRKQKNNVEEAIPFNHPRKEGVEHDIDTFILEQNKLLKAENFSNRGMLVTNNHASSVEKDGFASRNSTKASQEVVEEEPSEENVDKAVVSCASECDSISETASEVQEQRSRTIEKTPVQCLMEVFPPPRFKVVFTDVSSLCFCHQGKFQFHAQVGCLSAYGLGMSKREAKHSAAQEILNLWFSPSCQKEKKSPFCFHKEDGEGCKPPIPTLAAHISETFIRQCSLGRNSVLTYPSPPSRTQSTSFHRSWNELQNSIGTLNELCLKHKLGSPVYEFHHSGEGLDIHHVALVKAAGCMETGSGKSKKAAKHEAAARLLQTEKFEYLMKLK